MSDPDAGPNYAWWVPEDAMRSLAVEKALHGHETSAQLARRLLEETLPMATYAVCHIAANEPNPVVRLNAAKYVMEHVLGSPGKTEQLPEGGFAWDKVYGTVLIEAENGRRGQG